MRYQLCVSPTHAHDELARFLRFAKSLTVQFVSVGTPYVPSRTGMCLLEVPDAWVELATRALSIMTGAEDAVQPTPHSIRPRPEWTTRALLIPHADAQVLDGTLLHTWASACLSVFYRSGRCVAEVQCSPEDLPELDRLATWGWRVIRNPLPPVRMFVRLIGGRFAGAPSLAMGSAVQQVPDHTAAAVPEASPDPAIPASPPDVLAAPGTPGLLLGVATDGAGVSLAWRSMVLALDAGSEQRHTAVRTLIRRGLGAGMGVVAIVSREIVRGGALAAWEPRLRLLDGRNLQESAAIPWHKIAPDQLAAVFCDAGISAPLPYPLPDQFGALLEMIGAFDLCVPAVLGLTALPGDDLRDALAAGGLIVLVDDGDPGSSFLTMLLLAYLATAPLVERALLLISPPAVVPPQALADQLIHVVLGTRSDALLHMATTRAGWRVSVAESLWTADLLPDLDAQPSEVTEEFHAALIAGLTGNETGMVTEVRMAAQVAENVLPQRAYAEPIDQVEGVDMALLDPFADLQTQHSMLGDIPLDTGVVDDAKTLETSALDTEQLLAILPAADELLDANVEASALDLEQLLSILPGAEDTDVELAIARPSTSPLAFRRRRRSPLFAISALSAAPQSPATPTAHQSEDAFVGPDEGSPAEFPPSGDATADAFMPPEADAPGVQLHPSADDAEIWAAWQALMPLDAMLVAICGRQRGPTADALRDRIYAIVIPRIVDELGAGDLVRRLVARREPLVAQRALYVQLLQRIARSARPIGGRLSDTIRTRLISTMQHLYREEL